MEAVAEQPRAEAASGREDVIVGLLEQMSARLESLAEQNATLAERVQAVETAAPRFVPASVETYGAASQRFDAAQAAPADGIPRSQTVPITSAGDRLPDFVLRQYPPRYGSGMRVQLNPDAVPHGRDDGKTRGELKAADGTPWGIAEVIDRTFLTQEGSWKYRVRFANPRVVTGAHGGITALHEPELLPA